jgi:hypothetical protein
MSISVVVYGVILILLSLIVHSIDPELARLATITGTAGGALCVLLGVLGWLGHKVRGWTIAALVAVSYLLLSQVVLTWLGGEAGLADGLLASILLTLKLLASIGLVAYLAHFGGQHQGGRRYGDG